MKLSREIADALEHYHAEGYAVLHGVFSRDEIAALRVAFDRHWQIGMAHRASWRHGNRHYRLGQDAALGKVLRLVQWPSYEDEVLAGVRTDARLLALLEPLLGGNIKQIINQMHWKPPGAAAADFAYHQDARFRRPPEAYRDLGRAYVQTGLAIDRHTKANGAMRVVPRSHLLGQVALEVAGAVMNAAMADDSLRRVGLDPALVVDLELEPGDLAIWSVYTIHGSGPNTTSGERRFYLNGYVRAADCDRGEWAWRGGEKQALGKPVLVHYEQLYERPDAHYIDP